MYSLKLAGEFKAVGLLAYGVLDSKRAVVLEIELFARSQCLKITVRQLDYVVNGVCTSLDLLVVVLSLCLFRID